ncbi:MotA/TolQ/ExbB proton channel family protein [Vibrio ostreicida]|uniref:MotA/TolQ/ExbB proton channel family protein n=1 Tax=Vibrio ostreicida TaxID=526588 RepID=UPI003B5AC217
MINWGVRIAFVLATIFIVNDVASLGDAIQFIDLTSFLMVVVPTLFAAAMGYLNSRAIAIRCAIYTAVVSSLLGALIGVIQTFGNTFGDTEAIFVGLSVALLPLFYGLTISLLLIPFHLSSND